MASKKKAVSKKKVAPRKRATKKVVKNKYKASMTINGETFEVSGPTLADAFNKFVTMKPVLVKSTIILQASCGKKNAKQIFYTLQFRRFMFNRMIRQIWAKRIEIMMR